MVEPYLSVVSVGAVSPSDEQIIQQYEELSNCYGQKQQLECPLVCDMIILTRSL